MTGFMPAEEMSVADMAKDIAERGVRAVSFIVDDIRALAESDRDWACHEVEDSLYAAVLYAISSGQVTDVVAVALAALETKELDFPRYTM